MLSVSLIAGNTIDIPLRMSVVQFMPSDNPTGSTPDPTDPNQFRVSLSGNTLTIHTQKDEVSYVVIRSDFSEKKDEDYFYSLSFDSVSCPITESGKYEILIGHWNADFKGSIHVKSIILCDFNGNKYDTSLLSAPLPPGIYIMRLETNFGYTYTKIMRL